MEIINLGQKNVAPLGGNYSLDYPQGYEYFYISCFATWLSRPYKLTWNLEGQLFSIRARHYKKHPARHGSDLKLGLGEEVKNLFFKGLTVRLKNF